MMKHRITGMNRRGLTASAPSSRLTASRASVSANTMMATEFQYYMTNILATGTPQMQDSAQLGYMFRDMYLYDSVGGAAVDIQSTFPFSDFSLRGLSNKELQYYTDACDALSLRRMMPELSTAYLSDGFFCGSLIFDPKRKQFMDTMVHDALACTVNHMPFYNVDADIRVNVASVANRLLSSSSEYVKRYLATLPESVLTLLRNGSFDLDPAATLYVPRQSLTDRAYTSYLQRLLPMYLIEKALFRGTLTEAHRRQRATTLITAGNDMWIPEDEELAGYIDMVQTSEWDPLGGYIAVRDGVQVQDIRPAGDFWKWTDSVDVMVPYKLRALGISEAFLSGDASYAAAESAYSTFLETQESYRYHLTDLVFYQRIFPLVAVVNGLYKEGTDKRLISGDANTFLFDAKARNSLKIPELHWHKELQAEDEGLAEALEMLDEKGFPVPMKMWLAAGKIDPEHLLREVAEDSVYRRKLEQLSGKDTSHDQEGEEYTHEASAPFMASSGARRRRPLMSREFEGEHFTFTRTGKPKAIYNQAAAKRKQNDQILKSAKSARDPNYRKALRSRNMKAFGKTRLYDQY